MRKIVLFMFGAMMTMMFTGCTVWVDDADAGDDVAVTQQALEVYDALPTSGSKTVSVPFYTSPAHIIISSPSSGNWKFETYSNPGSAPDCWNGNIAVFTFWRDTSVSESWNYWPGGGAVCWPSSLWSTNLQSGSSTIQYKFQYQNYADYAGTAYAKFTKL